MQKDDEACTEVSDFACPYTAPLRLDSHSQLYLPVHSSALSAAHPSVFTFSAVCLYVCPR
eukprot:scaffold282713_cov24-Tisochrysis_lutea.AAC.1